MARYAGAQSSWFGGIVNDIALAKPPVWKCIDPDSDILREIKRVSPQTKTIARIYTGQPTVDDAGQHPDPYLYGKQYAQLAYSRLKDPAHTDYLESENEPNDHYGNLTEFIKRVNAFLVGFSEQCQAYGIKPCGPNFSTGYPEVFVPGTDYELWGNAWQGLADGLRALKAAGGALGLHEYDAPDLFRLWSDSKQLGYLVGRHKAVYRVLPADLQDLELYLTEYGIDWLVFNEQGGFWHNRDEHAPVWYMQQLREAWARIYSTTPQLRGACVFLHGNNNAGLWEEYDTMRTDTSRAEFVRFMQEELPGGTPPPSPSAPPPEDTMPTPLQRLNNVWSVLGIAYNPTAAFPKKARELGLGRPVTQEYRYNVENGLSIPTRIAGQGFDLAFLECAEGDWGNMVAYDYLTGDVYVPAAPQPPPAGGIPPFVMPSVFTAAGFIGEDGLPMPGELFYRLSPTGAVRTGVSAFCDVTVLDTSGSPLIGAQVVSQRQDGKGEILATDGGGKVRFYFGPGSAFTPPAVPPFDIFVALNAVKDEESKLVSYDAIMSDIVSVGDSRGDHTETYMQFKGYQL